MLRTWRQAHADELRRAGRRERSRSDPPAPPAFNPVTLRFAFPDDADALWRLAAIDSSEPPAMPVLLAEVGGELRAALSLADGRVVADPFRHTGAVVDLLHARARQLSGEAPRRRLRRARFGLVSWRSAWR